MIQNLPQWLSQYRLSQYRLSHFRPSNRVSRLLALALAVILPKRCSICLLPSDAGICQSCLPLLPWIEHGCNRCAAPLGSGGICGDCQSGKRPIERTVAPFRYRSPIARQVQLIKYHNRLDYVEGLAELLANAVIRQTVELPDAIVPIPLHKSRMRQRGYNQALLLANALSTQLGVPVATKLLIRPKATESQTSLNKKQRRQNLQDAFAVTGSERYHSVALVDDVITSGATMTAAAKVLHQNGVSNINAWAIAKA